MQSKIIQDLREIYAKKSKSFDENLLKIPVISCLEDFVYLPDEAKKALVEIIFAENKTTLYFLRKSVAKALIDAAKYFKERNFTLKVESAYRTLSAQRERFQHRIMELRIQFPEKSEGELMLIANTFTAGIPILAAHTAGAAVDVTLVDAITGSPLNFGVLYLHGDVESVTDFLYLAEASRRNRNILKEGMEKFGFINYPFEYWHYSIGDVCAAFIDEEDAARYEPVEFDPVSGKLEPLNPNIIYNYFSVKI